MDNFIMIMINSLYEEKTQDGDGMKMTKKIFKKIYLFLLFFGSLTLGFLANEYSLLLVGDDEIKVMKFRISR